MTEQQIKWVYGGRESHTEKHEDKAQEFVIVKLDGLVFETQWTEEQGNDELNLYANQDKNLGFSHSSLMIGRV